MDCKRKLAHNVTKILRVAIGELYIGKRIDKYLRQDPYFIARQKTKCRINDTSGRQVIPPEIHHSNPC